jgi:hypothetical protein
VRLPNELVIRWIADGSGGESQSWTSLCNWPPEKHRQSRKRKVKRITDVSSRLFRIIFTEQLDSGFWWRDTSILQPRISTGNTYFSWNIYPRPVEYHPSRSAKNVFWVVIDTMRAARTALINWRHAFFFANSNKTTRFNSLFLRLGFSDCLSHLSAFWALCQWWIHRWVLDECWWIPMMSCKGSLGGTVRHDLEVRVIM